MSGTAEEQNECPLCMEPLEIDDINFYPCTCGYQICRFCWHRIRTDENGLCPACRKAYPEDPAKFNPLTDDELQRIKKERRQKDLQRKQKAAENRKHLANVRVVQRNLVFVVGLSQRLADPEVLKKQEYFGKFGKIHKVVINQSTSYAGAQPCSVKWGLNATAKRIDPGQYLKADLGQKFGRFSVCPRGPSASAYVTYNKPDDALKAILAVNNVHVDGRTLKASLGTTKYCSHFLRGTQCPKTDCMYLHELGEEAASFTKEEMQVGKHQEYEQKLLEQYMNSQNTAQTNQQSNNKLNTANRKKASSPPNVIQPSQSPPQTQMPSPPQRQTVNTSPPYPQIPNTTNKDAWPSLQPTGNTRQDRAGTTNNTQIVPQTNPDRQTDKQKTDQTRAPGKHRISESEITQLNSTDTFNGIATEPTTPAVNNTSPRQHSAQSLINSLGNKRKSLGLDSQDNLSLFSSINGYHGNRSSKPLVVQTTEVTDIPSTEIPDTIPVKTSTDWQAAFGFGQSTKLDSDWQDDDLGFDPLEESSRGLADLIEKENGQRQQQQHNSASLTSHMFNGLPTHTRSLQNNIAGNIPPGFSHSHLQHQSNFPLGSQTPQSHNYVPLPSDTDVLSSRMSGYVNPPLQNSYNSMFTDLPYLPQSNNTHQNDVFNMKDWQDGLRALLPNINISFGTQQLNNVESRLNTQHNSTQKNWVRNNVEKSEPSWMACDPAILTSSTFTSDAGLQDPHWLKSFSPLTDIDTNNHRLPFVQQFPVRNTVWPPQTHNPPPGFQTHMRPPLQTADKLADGLQ